MSCYVDDLAIYTNDWKSHLQQLELEHIAGCKYLLQPKECGHRSLRDRILGVQT